MGIRTERIGELLIKLNLISKQQLDTALVEKKRSGKRLGQVLIDLGYVDQNLLAKSLSDQLGVPFIDLRSYSIDPEIVHLLPEAAARRLNAIALNKDERGFLVGMVDPLDVLVIDELEQILQDTIRVAVISENDLDRTLDIYYRRESEISSLSQELSAEVTKSDYDILQLATDSSIADAPVVKLLKTIFEDAAQVNASDIHIEPDEKVLRLRLRIDGVLHEQILKQKKIADALSLRLKLMAGLNIAEKRIPQDGRFSIKVKDKKFDVRLSSIPSQHGESVVMRLLNQSADLIKLEQMGIPTQMLTEIRRIMSLPHGLLLITGPTGSGKTTTLYGMLNELNTQDVKIITVEDPVEYRLNRITQIQIEPIIDLTFARALRSILRQDPDIIMIGELRDKETAEMALRAAMTGHFVFATLHTNDAMSSAERLIDMGMESYLVASVLLAAISQRLVRRICKNCMEDHTLTLQEEVWLSSVSHFAASGKTFKQGAGCSFCYETGYKGRIGVFELLTMNRPLADALRKQDRLEFINLIKNNSSFVPLTINGLNLAAEGMTTIEEVMHVSGEIAPEAPKS